MIMMMMMMMMMMVVVMMSMRLTLIEIHYLIMKLITETATIPNTIILP